MLKKSFKVCLACIASSVLIAFSPAANAQSWQEVGGAAAPLSANQALLLTDGAVLVQDYKSAVWWKLIPDATGSYVTGKWKQAASMPNGYGPLYYSSAVLKSGKVVVVGGEYLGGVNGLVNSNLGAIYEPVKDTWTAFSGPNGWTAGASASIVLDDGRFMLADTSYPNDTATLDEATMTWKLIPGTGKQDPFDEEGWTLLPDKTVLTVDVGDFSNYDAERYFPGKQDWEDAGLPPVNLVDTADDEIGPAVLMPDGRVFAFGGTDSTGTQTGHTAIYTPPVKKDDPGSWTAGPDFPNFNSMSDAPGALLITGKVLVQTVPGNTAKGSTFYEYDGNSFTLVPAPPNAVNDQSYTGRMLELPTGQILFTDTSNMVEIYTPNGTYQPAWAPTITSAPTTIARGNTYQISGTQFNGLSQGAMYGDDAQMATNYPLVRITNSVSGHVSYARTHDHSTMGVATGSAIVSTMFDIDAKTEPGTSTMVVVTNGIPSAPVNVNVQ